jgi:hypothetical protein
MSIPSYLLGGATHAVSVVNQTSTPLIMQINRLVFVLHDNRIYVFERTDAAILGGSESSTTATPEQTVILNLLTTPFFRFLSIIYIVFRIFDNTALIAVIVISVYQNRLSMPSNSSLALMATIGLEIFYDVMLNVNKYWALQRLSFLIGIVLFVAYFIILLIKVCTHEIGQDEFKPVLAIVSARLVAFLFEELVDVAIDCCLHNALHDLASGTAPEKDIELGNSTTSSRGCLKILKSIFCRCCSAKTDAERKELLEHAGTTLKCMSCSLPAGSTYKGSFFAWGTNSVYNISEKYTKTQNTLEHSDILQVDRFSWCVIKTFLALPALLAVCFIVLVMVLAIIAAAIAMAIVSVWYAVVLCFGDGKKTAEERGVHYTHYVKELWRV